MSARPQRNLKPLPFDELLRAHAPSIAVRLRRGWQKKLSERMAHLSSGEVVQRDLYSAFLLEYIDTESLEYNTKALNSAFPAFLVMHENTIKRLQKDKSYLPASVGF